MLLPCHREVIWWRDSPNGAIEAVPVERRVRGNSHARCGVGEKPEIASKAYLSLSLEIAEALVRSGAVDIIVIDSVAALVPKAEIEGEMGDAHVGLQARLMSQALRKLSGAINKSKTIAIFINQIREKVGVMFGNPETTPGGRALKFYASVRLEVRRAEQIKQGNDMVGNKTKIKVVKNKVAPPFKTADVDIMYGEGISREGEIIDMASELDIVQKSGSWYSYKDERLGQGRENAKQFLKENPHIAEEIARAIRKHYGIDDGEAGGEPMQDEFGMLEE
ncbi:recombinase RecA [Geobacillus stearothermophilus]|uniref:recombinase RecA n=1 Tax=Geobacillus stearothermophilus TaxID=1422 RepID=UPI002E2262FF